MQFAQAEPEAVAYVEPRARPLPVAEPEPVAVAVAVAELVPAAEVMPTPENVAAVLVQSAAAPVAPLPTSFEDNKAVADYVAPKAVRKVARSAGKSNSVVQLGAYGSPQRVAAAWDQFARRYGSLGRYTPVSMRFSQPQGHRLSAVGQGLCLGRRSAAAVRLAPAEGQGLLRPAHRRRFDRPVRFALISRR